jgi:hypothetical protein
MVPARPHTTFLSWVIEDPDRIERYHSSEGFHDLVELWEHDLPDDLQEILDTNDLRSALDVIKRETGGENVLFFVIMLPPPPPPKRPRRR